MIVAGCQPALSRLAADRSPLAPWTMALEQSWAELELAERKLKQTEGAN
jgi:hypothetical protein